MMSTLLPFLLAVGVVATDKPAEPPIACHPKALDETQRKRQQELLEVVRRSAQATHELADGFAFRLASDPALFQQAAEWVTLERRCCPFIHFALEWKRDQPTTTWMGAGGAPAWRMASRRPSGATPYQAAWASRATTRGREAWNAGPSSTVTARSVSPSVW
jgi:hypothetical protein